MKTHVIVDTKKQIDKFKLMLKESMIFLNENYKIKNNTHVVLNNGNRVIFMEEKVTKVDYTIDIMKYNRNKKLNKYLNRGYTVWGNFNYYNIINYKHYNYLLHHRMIDVIADLLNLKPYGEYFDSIIHWYFETKDWIRHQKSEAKFIRWYWNKEADNCEKRVVEMKEKINELSNNFKNQ